MKKKIIGILSFCALACALVAVNTAAVRAEENAEFVYVSQNGLDTNVGSSQNPLKTVDKALEKAVDGGTIVIQDVASLSGWEKHGKLVEITGGTLKLLYTLENKSCFYDLKFLHEFLYVFLFAVGEGLLIPVMGHIFHFTESLSIALLLRHVLCLLLASVPVLCLQHLLSLMAENQIAPLFLGLVGSFLGLFSMFFSPAVAHFVLWAYFGAFLPYGMDYDPSSRIISFYQVPFPLPVFIVFLIFTILLYAVCRKIFLKKEV